MNNNNSTTAYLKLKRIIKTLPGILTVIVLIQTMISIQSWYFWVVASIILLLFLYLRVTFLYTRRFYSFFTKIFYFILVITIISFVFHVLKPSLEVQINKKVFGQAQAIKSLCEALREKSNLFVFFGNSGVGKTMLADTLAKDLRKYEDLSNIYSIRLSDLQSQQLSMYITDINQIFSKQNRNSIGYFTEVQCKAPQCVVLLDDFHIFDSLRPEESKKLTKKLSTYTSEHKHVIFIIVIESTSVMSTEDFKPHVDFNRFLAGTTTLNFAINGMLKNKVPSLELLGNYTLIPLASLSKSRADWSEILPAAVKSKLLEIVSITQQTLRLPPLHVCFSEKLIGQVVDTAFADDEHEGMRLINNDWSPVILEVVKHKCPTECPVLQELYIDTDGKEISCNCQSLISLLKLKSFLISAASWADDNGNVLNHFKNILLALVAL